MVELGHAGTPSCVLVCVDALVGAARWRQWCLLGTLRRIMYKYNKHTLN